MTINKAIIEEFEHMHCKPFSSNLKRYLFLKYEKDPFPHEFSEQDLYTNIRQDICNYEVGELDVTVKSLNECWQQEREQLQDLYIEKCSELIDLEEYIAELEEILSEHGIKSSRMAGQKFENKKMVLIPF